MNERPLTRQGEPPPPVSSDPSERTFSYAPAGIALDRCPYCGQRKRADRPSCTPCNDLPGLEPL